MREAYRSSDGRATVLHGDCVEVMKTLPDACIDAIVCDPPYGLEFMGKEWDNLSAVNRSNRGTLTNMVTASGKPKFQTKAPAFDLSAESQSAMQAWHTAWCTEAFRVLKPGGHLLAFGGTRTFHRLACAVEDAGFEIRDSVIWCYGSGFPKSHDVSKAISKLDEESAKAWVGWGSALKPAYEPVVVGRKPLDGTLAANTLKHGVGGLNIDACRISGEAVPINRLETWSGFGQKERPDYEQEMNHKGRWPANLLLSHSPSCVHLDTADDTDLWACVPGCPIRAMDAQSGPSGGCAPASGPTLGKLGKHGIYCKATGENMGKVAFHGKVDGASRFFMRFDPNDAPFLYQAKANTKERSGGVDGRNTHPTVKPIDLMAYLCRLVTHANGVVLDPFLGSGTTGVAALREGFRFIGIEREAEYVDIAVQRIKHQLGDALPKRPALTLTHPE